MMMDCPTFKLRHSTVFTATLQYRKTIIPGYSCRSLIMRGQSIIISGTHFCRIVKQMTCHEAVRAYLASGTEYKCF